MSLGLLHVSSLDGELGLKLDREKESIQEVAQVGEDLQSGSSSSKRSLFYRFLKVQAGCQSQCLACHRMRIVKRAEVTSDAVVV